MSAATLGVIFESQSKVHEDTIAVEDGSVVLTYGELTRRVNRLARCLRSRGVGRGTIVGYCFPRSIETAICTLAIVRAGGAYLPLDPDYPINRLLFMLADAGAKLLLVPTSGAERFEPANIATLEIDAVLTGLAEHSDDPLDEINSPDDCACVLYTSGSSGTPKGVMIRHTSIVGHVCDTNWVEFKPSDRIAQLNSLSFDPATTELWGAWLHGATLVMLPVESLIDSQALCALIRERRLTKMFIPAGLLNIHAARAPGIFGELETLATGGEPADPVSLAKILRSPTPPRRLLNVYGPTEATTQVTYYVVPPELGADGPELPKRIPIGMPVTGARCLILDAQLRPVSGSEEGELYIGGRPLSAGYLNRPDLNAESFIADPTCSGELIYRTGDRARWLPDGNLDLLGRVDHQIKLRDHRIEPGEVQAAIAMLPGIEQSYVMLRQDLPGQRQLVAYIVWAARAPALSSPELRRALRPHLPAPMIPDLFVALDRLPLTRNRKVDRDALPVPGRVAAPEATHANADNDALGAQIPTDRPRLANTDERRSVVELTLDPNLIDLVRRAADNARTSVDVVLLCAWSVLLTRWSGRDDAAVVVRGKSVRVLALDLEPTLTFSGALERVRIALEESPRSATETFATQLGFAANDNEHTAIATGDVLRTAFSDRSEDLFLELTVGARSGLAALHFREDLFEPETSRQLLSHYVRFLENALASPDEKCGWLPLLGPDEQLDVLKRFNATSRVYPRTTQMHELFEQRVRSNPHATAIVHAGQQLSYAELNDQANQLAHHLRSLGVGPEVIVGIGTSRSPTMVAAMLAVMKAGGAYLPLDPDFPKDRLAFMLADSSAAFVLTDSSLRSTFDDCGAESLCLDEISYLLEPNSVRDPALLGTSSQLAYVIYTSGSTGNPKGVMVSHRSAVNFLVSMQDTPGMTSQDRILAITTLSFDIALLELMLPLISGATIVLAASHERSDPVRLASMLDGFAITIMQGTPTTWSQLVATGWKGRPGLRVLVGGEALHRKLADDLLARCSELWNMYGPTETTVWSTCWRVPAGEPSVFLGSPIANTRCLVLDRNLQLVPNGVFGELCIGGESLARGYLHRPELTASRFIADPYTPGERLYRTGDRVRWRSRGVLEFSRRLDRQVKLRGNRIELGEIETALEAQAGVERSLVVVREDRPGDERLVAYVVGRDLSSNELREQLVRTLPRTAIPSAICVLDAFPLTPNSKLDLNALPKPTDYVAHSTPDAPEAMDAVQHWLAGEWRQLLNVYRVRLDDDFFELGGHSLLALTLLTRIANRYGVRLTLATLFAAPTVRAQAKLLSDDFKVQRKRAVVPIQSVGTRPVLFFCSGWAGPILSLRALAEVLGDDQPLYLLDYFTDSQPDGITVAMIAAKLIDEMKLLQATGPYHLAGYSLGAKIVYEMARQLGERGESVPVLVLLDSYAPGHPILPPFAIRTLLHVRQALRLGPLRMWPYLLKYTVRLRRFVVDIEPAMYEGQLDEATTQFVAGLQRSAMALRRAAMQYEVSSYPGRVMLIRAADMSDWGIGANDPDPTGGWRDYAGSAECIGSLPSTHSHMLEVKHAVELGALLKISLDSAESARPVAEAGQHRASRPGVEKRP